jgi:hypothetical protein
VTADGVLYAKASISLWQVLHPDRLSAGEIHWHFINYPTLECADIAWG